MIKNKQATSHCIPITELQNFCIAVKEPVQEAYLSGFIINAFNQNELEFLPQYRVFYTFLEKTNEYQISYYLSKNKNDCVELEKLPLLKKSTQGMNILYVYKNFFAFFIQGELYFYQVLSQPLSLKEIEEYVKRRLHIKVFETQVVSKLNEAKNVQIQLQILQKQQYRQSLFFGSYYLMFFIALAIMWHQVFAKEEALSQRINEKQKEYKQLQSSLIFKGSMDEALRHLHSQLILHDVKIESLNYKKGTFELLIISDTKSKLYALLENKTIALYQSRLKYNASKKNYVLHTLYKSI